MEYKKDLKVRHLQSVCVRNLYIGKNEQDLQVIPEVKQHRSSFSEYDVVHSEKLLELNNRMLLDSFIAVYVTFEDTEHLLYLSEVVESNKNPTYAPISLPILPMKLANSYKLVVKIWCKPRLNTTSLTKKWYLLSKNTINSKKLIYIGPSLVNLEDNFQLNSIIINLNNHYYTRRRNLKQGVDLSTPNTLKSRPLKSYNFDSIRLLTNLSQSLRELIVSKHKINQQISNILPVPTQKNDSSLIDQYLSLQLKTIEDLEAHILMYQMNIKRITQFAKLQNQDLHQSELELIECQIDPVEDALQQYVYPLIIEELQGIIKVINQALTIENIDNSIQFSINAIPFPSTIRELLDTCYLATTPQPVDQINAGLAYIVQLILVLNKITNSFVNYPMELNDSQWYINDLITTSGITAYPLFYDSTTTEKLDNQTQVNQPFEKGLTLLSKNLTILIENIVSLYHTYHKRNDIHRQTSQPLDSSDNFLWNLQYLLLFITAQDHRQQG